MGRSEATVERDRLLGRDESDEEWARIEDRWQLRGWRIGVDPDGRVWMTPEDVSVPCEGCGQEVGLRGPVTWDRDESGSSWAYDGQHGCGVWTPEWAVEVTEQWGDDQAMERVARDGWSARKAAWAADGWTGEEGVTVGEDEQ